MAWSRQPYLLLLTALIIGCAQAFPPNKGHYVVTWTGDDEAGVVPEHALLGSKMCTRGPSYWCHNITHAAECHAMQHCITKVWEHPKEQLPADNDSVCEVCLDMVKQARDQLLSNETQDELRQVLEGSCDLIPLQLVSKECRKLADDFIPELIDALTSRMDPQMVCHISGLCNSQRIDDLLAQAVVAPTAVKPLDPDNVDTCPKCEHYIGEAVESLKVLTKRDLRIKLLGICGYLGSYSDSCRQAVIHELDTIYNYIQKNMQPKELCSLIGLCVESNLHRVPLNGGVQQGMTSVRVWQPPVSKAKKDELECDFCKQLTVSVHNWLVANATEDEFQKVIEGLCKNAGKYKQECLNLADQYSKQLYQLLVEGLDPDEVCKSIGVCPNGLARVQLSKDTAPIWTMIAMPQEKSDGDDDSSSSSEEAGDDDDDIIPLMKLIPSERLTGDDEIISPRIPLRKLIPGERLAGDDEVRPKAKAECQFCQYALHYLQQYLDEMKTEEEIRQKVDKLCTEYLPESVADQCKVFVEEYGDALVTLIAQEVDPTEVCPRLRLCPRSGLPQPRETGPAPVADILPTCAICTFTIEKIIDLTGKNLTKESIDHAMESVCRIVPRSEKQKCLGFMKNYGDQVAEMIVIYGTSHGVCAALHLCLMEPAPVQKIVVESALPLDRYLPQAVTLDRVRQLEDEDESRDDSRKCVICEFVITTLDQRLQDNATEEEIKSEVEHVCTYLPKTVRDRCQSFVELYGEEVIQYLSQEVDPQQICERLKLCLPQVVTEPPKKIDDDNAIRHLNMDRCQLCMLVSNYLRSLITEEEADKDIERLARNTCALLPKSYKQECKAMIEDYGSYLINILLQETDNGKACAQIQLCPSKLGPDVSENTIEVFEY